MTHKEMRQQKLMAMEIRYPMLMMTVEISSQKSMPMGRKRPMNITAGIWLQKHSLMTKKEQKH